MVEMWRNQAIMKRNKTFNKIPASWVISQQMSYVPGVTEKSTASVLHYPLASGIMTERELKITELYDATDLLDRMRSRMFTCEEVMTAFCKRAAIAHQVVNCLTEIMFEEAIAQARLYDKMIESRAQLRPLHGLPISLKDSFNVKGVETTIGYVSFSTHGPATSHSYLVDILIHNGAIPFCKTNIPQTMMSADTHNNLFGRTVNPNNRSLTAGGSSGGEGALLKMRGSVLGVATDIAGSCRLPALCNGVKSFKPTAGRIPFGNKVPPGRLGSPSSIVPVIGPMGHSVRDFELFMRSVIDSEPWLVDENVLDVPWRRLPLPREQDLPNRLRFGLIAYDLERPLHPPVLRTMCQAAQRLKDAGHTVLRVEHPSLWSTAVLAWKYFLLDPQKTPAKHVKGEPWVPSIAITKFPELEGWEPSIEELFQMNVERAKVLKFYHDIFVEAKLDAIIMPGYQATAVPHDTFGVPIFTVLPNLINFPAGILPFLKADWELDRHFFAAPRIYEPPYNPESIQGAPCAIQIMGRPMRDEELLEVMKVVETVTDVWGEWFVNTASAERRTEIVTRMMDNSIPM